MVFEYLLIAQPTEIKKSRKNDYGISKKYRTNVELPFKNLYKLGSSYGRINFRVPTQSSNELEFIE